jgi:hypothetical protein
MDYFSSLGFQVVLKMPADGSLFRCQVIDQLPCPNPALISAHYRCSRCTGAIGSDGGESCPSHFQTLRFYAVRFTNTLAPCRPRDSGVECFAHDQPACRKVLVLVGDGTQISDPTGALAYWRSKLNVGDPQYVLLPACPEVSKSAMATALQSWVPGINVFGWAAGPEDVVPSVCVSAGIVPEDYRVFISYRREDGQVHADKLFDALTQRGFDVFLDRVRIAPGANILDRIRRDLADKSFLLVLETPQLNRSSWVTQEIAFAAAHRLGIHLSGLARSTRPWGGSPKRAMSPCTMRLNSLTSRVGLRWEGDCRQ